MGPKYLAAFLSVLPFYCLFAQPDTVRILQEVTVSGVRETEARQSTLNIEPIQYKDIEQRGVYNLTDALARTPGVSQMTTGFAIAKPVIRGLYGNRILTLLSGLRFDNQQWQDEHGMGLSQMGIQRVEVIKGPASILYGTDALGGVINIIEEKVEEVNHSTWDLNTRFFSNTIGSLTDIGYQKYQNGKWFRMRFGAENHADYTDGSGTRVLNSRSNGYYSKIGWGSKSGRWKSENTYNASFTNFGFIVEDLNDIFEGDQRWSRSMQGPHHTVILNVMNSKHTTELKNGSHLQLNGGIQSNLRLENEGGGQISLNMHLLSLLANARWEKAISERTNLIANSQLTFENNKNFGARIIVPDANSFEFNASAFIRHTSRQWIIETGLGLGDKLITTQETKMLNSPDKEIQPFNTNLPSYNAMAGVSFLPHQAVTVKSNLSTGYRAPNLAELSSNGLHEGTVRYEIGDPGLDIEHNLNGDVSIEIDAQGIFVYFSTYYNQLFDYIYLAPTGKEFYGYPIYRYLQQDATIYGGETQVVLRPTTLRGFQLKGSYSQITATLADNTNLPFISPTRISGSVRFQSKTEVGEFYLEPEWQYAARQNNPAVFETPTPAYQLFNFYAGLELTNGIRIFLTGTNLLNENYADHLSRLKYFGLNNPGRNFVLNLHLPLTK